MRVGLLHTACWDFAVRVGTPCWHMAVSTDLSEERVVHMAVRVGLSASRGGKWRFMFT